MADPDIVSARIQLLRKNAAFLAALAIRDGEPALETDGERILLGDGSTTGGKWTIPLVLLSGLSEGDLIQYRSGKFVRVARQAAVAINSAQLTDSTGETADTTIAQVDAAVTTTDGDGGAGDAALASDVDARLDLANQNFADIAAQLNALQTEVAALRDRLKVTGGNGLIAD